MVTKLGIGMATGGLVDARTAFCLITAMQFVGVPMQLFLGIGCYVHQNRETIINQAIKGNCSHLLFVDSDMMFNHDMINKLMDLNKDVVGIKCNKKIFPLTPLVNVEELSEVPFVGTGIMLINMDVFKKMDKPYFSFDDKSESEDQYFCNKVIENGFKVWCDPTIPIGHIGTHIF
jgi:hypothetical protein